jgi:integrase
VFEVFLMNEQSRTEIEVVDLKGKELTNSSQYVKRDFAPYWDRDVLNDMISKVRDHKDRMLIIFLWRSGVRITEAVSLRKCDIDFKNFVMRVRWLKSRKYKERIVPIHPQLKDLLQLYTATLNLEDRVFPITRQRAWQITRKNLDGNPHKLRHSFAVNWLRCDGNIVTLHKILGHSKIQTTMEYLNIVPMDQGKELLKIVFD